MAIQCRKEETLSRVEKRFGSVIFFSFSAPSAYEHVRVLLESKFCEQQ